MLRGWLDPNGKFYSFGNFNYAAWEGVTHNDWAKQNASMLRKKYKLDVPIPNSLVTDEDKPFDYNSELIRSGWVRITDDHRRLGVQLDDIRRIPSFVDTHIMNTMGTDVRVSVEDLDGESVEELSGWAETGLQKAVQQQLRIQQDPTPRPVQHKEVPIPTPEPAPKPKRKQKVEVNPNQMELPLSGHKLTHIGITADAVQQIMQLVQSTGGATWNMSKGNMVGQPYYAVSVYPNDSVIIEHELTQTDLETYIKSKQSMLSEPNNSLGIWKNGDKYYLDIVVTISERDSAIALGKQHNQISIFDLQKMEEIPTGGTGEVQSKQASGQAEYWINPQGQEFLADEGHSRWIVKNLGSADLPQSEFSVEGDINEEDVGGNK